MKYLRIPRTRKRKYIIKQSIFSNYLDFGIHDLWRNNKTLNQKFTSANVGSIYAYTLKILCQEVLGNLIFLNLHPRKTE